MKTVVTKKVQSGTLTLRFGYWLEDTEEFVPVADENIGEAARQLGCTKELLETLRTVVGDIATTIHSDLKDIWERLDNLEEVIVG